MQLPAQAQNKHYELGQQAMHEQQYQKAFELFKQAEPDEKYTDAALYWQSYVLFKNKQDAKAKRTIKKLIKNHPKSQWLDDAKILALEHDIEKNQMNEAELESLELSEELKLFAIQQLMHNNEEKGLPLVKKMLQESKDKSIKMNALQLMGISDAEEATEYLYDFILKEKEFELKNQAIQMLSLRDSLQGNELLMQLYQKENNKQLKSSIIQGFIHSDDHKKLLEMLKVEKDKELSLQMIHLLGIMGANQELKDISKTIKDQDSKRALIQALALSGDGESIKDMIENSDDRKFKIEAIHSLIILDDDNTENYLFELYDKFKDVELKREVISVFIATDVNSDKILSLFKNETSSELKSKLIETLMILEDEQGLIQALELETDEDSKQKILQMLGVMGATDALAKLYNDNMNIETQRQIIHSMGLHESDQSEAFLKKAYKTDNADIKRAVIQALMIQDDAHTLITLLKQETDNDLKKELIRTISMINPDYILDKLNNN